MSLFKGKTKDYNLLKINERLKKDLNLLTNQTKRELLKISKSIYIYKDSKQKLSYKRKILHKKILFTDENLTILYRYFAHLPSQSKNIPPPITNLEPCFIIYNYF